MPDPPLYNGTDTDTEEPVLKTRLRDRLAKMKGSAQAMSRQITEAAQPKDAGAAAPRSQPPLQQQQQVQAPRAQPVEPQVRRALPVEPQDQTQAQAPAQAPAVTTGPATIDISGHPMLRGLAYGPNSEGATKADQGQLTGAWDQKLKEGDIAVSPNLQDRYPLRSYVDVVDKNGNVVLAKQHVADTSMIKEGVPTHNTFEVWNGKSLGEGYYLVPTTPPDYSAGTTASFAQGGIVTKPTVALVGEKGPEAIVPLDSLSSGAFSHIRELLKNSISLGPDERRPDSGKA